MSNDTVSAFFLVVFVVFSLDFFIFLIFEQRMKMYREQKAHRVNCTDSLSARQEQEDTQGILNNLSNVCLPLSFSEIPSN